MDALTFAALLISTARLTRLITDDKITEGFRQWVVSRAGDESLISYLVYCSWCVSVYTGAAVSLGWWAFGDQVWYQIILIALSCSYAAGFLNSKVDD